MKRRKSDRSSQLKTDTRKKLFKNQSFELQEAINSLRTNIRFASMDGNVKRILVTSSMPGEGKSVISLNLASSLAKNGSKVVLIDCDLRKPVLNNYMGLYKPSRNGLSTYLCGDTKLGECIVFDEEQRMYYLPAGITPPNPAEMLGSRAFAALMNYLSDNFDYVICDTPPVGIVADATVLSAVCDGVVFVVRHRFSKRAQVNSAIDALKAVNANILGIVLNDYTDTSRKDSNYGYYYYGDKTANKK